MSQAVAARSESAFGHLLRQWRAQRKLSQLELALICNVSQRHISFLESGRANPSRPMVSQLADAMEIPLRECNSLLQAAGFSPAYRESALSAQDMTPVRQALQLILDHHDPYPAMVVDRHWNLVSANASTLGLFSLLGDTDHLWQRVCPDGEPNIMRLTFHSQGLRPYLQNWEELAPMLLQRLHREALAHSSEPLRQLVLELQQDPGIPREWSTHDPSQALAPVVPMALAVDGLSVKLFSMITTFGTPQDVTTDELRVESFFPMDEATRRLLEELAG